MYKALFFDNPSSVAADELNSDMLELPAWRRQKALAFRFTTDRVQSVKAFLLLREGLTQLFGYTDAIEFAYAEHGKPLLKGHCGMHFNLSHCPKGVMCVVADHEVGCDIEEIADGEPDMSVMRRCFNEAEIDGILSAARPNVAFARLWTVKEAVLKLTGEGINDALPSLLTTERLSQLEIITEEQTAKGYAYSIAYNKQNIEKL